jgi:hypothetical protein
MLSQDPYPAGNTVGDVKLSSPDWLVTDCVTPPVKGLNLFDDPPNQQL